MLVPENIVFPLERLKIIAFNFLMLSLLIDTQVAILARIIKINMIYFVFMKMNCLHMEFHHFNET